MGYYCNAKRAYNATLWHKAVRLSPSAARSKISNDGDGIVTHRPLCSLEEAGTEKSALTDAERRDVLVLDELSVTVQMSLWFQHVRLWKQTRIPDGRQEQVLHLQVQSRNTSQSVRNTGNNTSTDLRPA